MDSRLFYVFGDFVASLLLGAIVGATGWLIVGVWWNMWIAMFVMMPIGMVAGLIAFFPAAIKLGAMEAMIPLMLTGMVSGMAVGMAAAMMPLTIGEAVRLGAFCGIASIGFIWIANALLRGVTREAKGEA